MSANADEAFRSEIGAAVLGAVERLEASPGLAGSVFAVAHPTAGLVTVRVSLRGAESTGGASEAIRWGKR